MNEQLEEEHLRELEGSLLRLSSEKWEPGFFGCAQELRNIGYALRRLQGCIDHNDWADLALAYNVAVDDLFFRLRGRKFRL